MNAPPLTPELKPFEDGILHLIKNIEFSTSSNPLLDKMKNEVKKINNDNKLIIKADKTSNHYRMPTNDYKSLLDKNIQKDYKKEDLETITRTNASHKKLVQKLDLQDRVFSTTPRQAYVTLKDHKDNFENNPACRLINPAKPEIGRISQKMLQNINSKVKDATQLTQWKNTSEVIEWFKKLENKKNLKFIKFDICEYYPSITPELLKKALNFAAQYVTISTDERNTILEARKCFLYLNGNTWAKKKNSKFDVTMGAWDGAECCDLVGLYMLSRLKLKLKLKLKCGLYRDDGLGVSDATPRQLEIIKKEICAVYKAEGLNITIEANKKSVDFLDIIMDLRDGLYRPYLKPSDAPKYVHKMSNHPPTITKNLPAGINKRLSSISANEDIFNQAAPVYQDALKNSGYDYELKFEPPQPPSSKKRCRSRKITWFNPPFACNVKTNIGAKFLRLLDKIYPKGHILHPLLNRNTIKISYRCLPNLGNIIAKHNAKLLKEPAELQPQDSNCNCNNKDECPLDGQCQTDKVIYQSTIKTVEKTENYVGLTANTFKKRWDGHKSNFRHEDQAGKTTLSGYIWKLKKAKVNYEINWRIICRASPFSPATGLCALCTTEKFYIIFRPEMGSLNVRNELGAHCRHKERMLLDNT